MTKKRILIISQYLITDPPTKNIIDSLFNEGYDIHYIEQSEILRKDLLHPLVNVKKVKLIKCITSKKLVRLFNLIYFKFYLNNYIKKIKPDIVITIMYLPMSLVKLNKEIEYFGVILDIPYPSIAGNFDRFIYEKALNKLNNFNLVWASDELKSEIITNQANLIKKPLVCYNCPPLNYFIGYKQIECRKWLINKLIKNGITILPNTIIILRAGAIGKYGGIEETILSLRYLPLEFVFVLMGRPSDDYINYIQSFIQKNQMTHRVILINQPSDSDWKKILLGSDVGHMIHIRPSDDDPYVKVYDLNSSLSNNRLFQYMAAGLSIISYNDERLNNIHKEADCFIIVDVKNLEKNIALSLGEIIKNPAINISFKKNSHKLFLKKYNWENQFNKILTTI